MEKVENTRVSGTAEGSILRTVQLADGLCPTDLSFNTIFSYLTHTVDLRCISEDGR